LLSTASFNGRSPHLAHPATYISIIIVFYYYLLRYIRRIHRIHSYVLSHERRSRSGKIWARNFAASSGAAGEPLPLHLEITLDNVTLLCLGLV